MGRNNGDGKRKGDNMKECIGQRIKREVSEMDRKKEE